MRSAYLNQLLPTRQVSPGWTGDVSRCVATAPEEQPAAAVGTQSAASKKATFQAINFFRAMAGLAPVTEDPTASAQALQAALIMEASGGLSHTPDAGWPCYSAAGLRGASTSNLLLGGAEEPDQQGPVVGESASSGPVQPKPPMTTPVPVITGAATVGKKLTAAPGTWKPATTKLTYQWYADGAKIGGATASTLMLKKAQKGKKITVKVTGKAGGYTTVTKTSSATKKVA